MAGVSRYALALGCFAIGTVTAPLSAVAESVDNSGVTQAVVDTLDAQLDVLDKTERILQDKYRARRDELKKIVRKSYKSLRRGRGALWVGEGDETSLVRRRDMIRRLLAKQRAQLKMLRGEIDAIAVSRTRIQNERKAAETLVAPALKSLRLPVAFSDVVENFGSYKHDRSRTRLSRRGLTLSSRPGRNVRAIADGRVRYVGEVRGLGHTVIVDHGDFWSVLGALTPGHVKSGRSVTRGQILGESVGDRVYFEVRLEVGPGGFPVDPTPLVDWR